MNIKKRFALKKYKKVVIYQQEKSDCGVACLSTILNLFNRTTSLENLRNLSGTDNTGTSVLGLCQASEKFGVFLKAEKFKSEVRVDDLTFPKVLLIDYNILNHYVVLLDKIEDHFLLFDPEKGLCYQSETELLKTWNTLTCISVLDVKNKSKDNSIKYDKDWLKKIVKNNGLLLLSSVLLVIISNILNVSIFVFLQKIVDIAIPSKNYSILISFATLIFLAVFLKSIISYFKNKLNNDFVFDTNLGIIDHFISVFFKLPKSFFSHKKPGEVVARFNDSNKIIESLMFLVNESLKNSIMIIISLPVIFYFSIKIGFIAILSIILLFLVSLLFTKKFTKHQQTMLMKNALRTGGLINIIEGIDYLRLSGKTDFFSLRYRNLNKYHQQSMYDANGVKYSLMLCVELLSGITMLFVLIVCSIDSINGVMQVGQLIATFSLFISLTPSIVSLPFINMNLKLLRVAVNRVNELEHIKIRERKSSTNIWKFEGLEFKNIYFNYHGCNSIIRDLSFEIKKNQFICIIGESGIGKSTLINLIIGLAEPPSGDILINNLNSKDIVQESWNKVVGYVEQNVPIYNGNVFFNISLGVERSPQEIIKFCINNGIHDFILSFPQAYLTQLGDSGHELSNGQKQVIGLVRAIFARPQLLILDEPSSALDYKTESIIMNILARHREKLTILLVTHRFNLTFMADIIHIIEDGKIKDSGTHDSLLEFDNFYSRYYNLLSLDV